jgi:hypothetical protein
VADDICSHGRPNHQDLIAELREAVGLAGPPLPITPQQAWEEAIAEVVALRAALATQPQPVFTGTIYRLHDWLRDMSRVQADMSGHVVVYPMAPRTPGEDWDHESDDPISDHDEAMEARRAARAVAGSATPDSHTRTSTSAGPDYCTECSATINEWVKWPCLAVAGSATPTRDDHG